MVLFERLFEGLEIGEKKLKQLKQLKLVLPSDWDNGVCV
jgi:hypothetical protein